MDNFKNQDDRIRKAFPSGRIADEGDFIIRRVDTDGHTRFRPVSP
jgi:hypothetical protein